MTVATVTWICSFALLLSKGDLLVVQHRSRPAPRSVERSTRSPQTADLPA